MKTILIAEDEMLVRVGIKSTVDWEKYGYQVIGEAANGREALEKIEELHPDILLTDIKMPEMDGIQLIREIRDRELPTESIILSCYDEFELAQEAMRYGASDYILKLTLTREKLLQALTRVSRKIEAAQRTAPTTVPVSVMKNSFLNMLRDSDHGRDSLNQVKALLKLRLDFDGLSCIAVAVDPAFRQEDFAYEELSKQEEKIVFGLISDCVENRRFGETFYSDHCCFVYTNLEDRERVIGAIRTNLSVLSNVSISFGMSTRRNYLPGLISALQDEALEALADRFLHGRASVNHLREDGEKRMENRWDTQFIRDIQRHIHDFSYIHRTVRRSVEVIRDHSACRDTAIRHLLRLYDALMGLFTQYKVNFDDNRNISVLTGMIYAEDAVYFFDWLLDRCFEQTRANVTFPSGFQLEETLAYIESHYGENLTMTSTAEHFNLSTTYFCAQFKKKCGKSFVEYLNEYRVEQAKVLLATTDQCIYMVAENVGFRDANYFSKVFKKIVHTTPETFKKELSQQERPEGL